jgi:hypothetical protein
MFESIAQCGQGRDPRLKFTSRHGGKFLHPYDPDVALELAHMGQSRKFGKAALLNFAVISLNRRRILRAPQPVAPDRNFPMRNPDPAQNASASYKGAISRRA